LAAKKICIQILLNQRKVEVLQDDREMMGTDRDTL